MSKTVIEFKDVTKIYKLYKSDKQRFKAIFLKNTPYNHKIAVDKLSFKISQGESVAIFGKNGAGKSTILKMIAEVAYPTSGQVTVDGRVSAILELTSGFDSEFTGRENIYLKGQILGLQNSEIKKIENDIIEFSELGDYIDQPIRTYSSGMKARLGFSINVNIQPEILIVDEALSVGDESFRRKCVKKINDIMEKDNITLLYVTHAIKTAKDFCKRGMVMKKGKLIFDGKIEEAIQIYEKTINEG